MVAMTERDQTDSDGPDSTNLEDVLDSFKAGPDPADIDHVSDPPVTKSRLNWRSVTDLSEETPPAAEDTPRRRSGFQFDLGGALSRLGGGRDDDRPSSPEAKRSVPLDEPLPQRGSGTSIRPSMTPPEPGYPAPAYVEGDVEPLPPLPRRDAAPAPVAERQPAEPMPEIREATSTDYDPRVRPAAHGSVFPEASVPSTTTLAHQHVVHSGRTAPAPIPQVGAIVPTLPAATPKAPPMIAAVVEAPSQAPDINALRSAQLKAKRQQHQGKLFGRTLLAVLVIAGAMAASLLFGRAYLFPTKWNPELTAVVDEVQLAAGGEFDHAVPLVVQPSGEYAVTVTRLALGESWTARIGEWRALGLASGDPSAESVGVALVGRFPVVFDPATDTLYRSAEADLEVIKPDIRFALESVYARQHSDQVAGDVVVATGASGLTGVSSPAVLAERAVTSFLARRSGSSAEAGPASGAGLPIPIAYELAAIDLLGEAVLLEAGADPKATLPGGYPEGIYAALDDNPVDTTSFVLSSGETSIADPVALGVDDWSLVWGVRLPLTTVNQLVGILTADSYRPIDRAGTTCAVGVLQTSNDADGAFLLGAMQRWAAAGPPTAQATVTALGTTRVQLVTCDPGPDGAALPDQDAVGGLIQRQLARLAR